LLCWRLSLNQPPFSISLLFTSTRRSNVRHTNTRHRPISLGLGGPAKWNRYACHIKGCCTVNLSTLPPTTKSMGNAHVRVESRCLPNAYPNSMYITVCYGSLFRLFLLVERLKFGENPTGKLAIITLIPLPSPLSLSDSRSRTIILSLPIPSRSFKLSTVLPLPPTAESLESGGPSSPRVSSSS
jgi:hypothetical protein